MVKQIRLTGRHVAEGLPARLPIMADAMSDLTAGLVDIVREFLDAHQLMRVQFARLRADELRFADIGELISGDESSVLFRLKERSHALFRSGSPGAIGHGELLFDLAVGSLFHETMKFRESFYQREVYGPRVRALRDQAGTEPKDLFRQFERMLAAGNQRIEEGLHECEALLDQTRAQLRLLLSLHRSNGVVARYLVGHAQQVEAVFGADLDALLAEFYGDAVSAYALAGRSYLESGYYAEAERALGEAAAHGGNAEQLEPLRAYARGMGSYLLGDYAGTTAHLSRWLDAGAPGDASLRALAQAAVSCIGELELGEDRERLVAEAAALSQRLAV
jgi:hypothetical protein